MSFFLKISINVLHVWAFVSCSYSSLSYIHTWHNCCQTPPADFEAVRDLTNLHILAVGLAWDQSMQKIQTDVFPAHTASGRVVTCDFFSILQPCGCFCRNEQEKCNPNTLINTKQPSSFLFTCDSMFTQYSCSGTYSNILCTSLVGLKKHKRRHIRQKCSFFYADYV